MPSGEPARVDVAATTAPGPGAPPVRVLFLYDHLGYPGGVRHGLTRYCLSVLPRLDRSLVDITACFLREPHPAADELRGAGVRTLFLSRGRWDLRAFTDVLRLVRSERIEVVHAAGQKGILVGRTVARATGRKALIHLHDVYPLPRSVRGAIRAMAGWTDLAIVVSRAVARHAVSEYRVREDRVQILYNGIDPAAFVPADPEAGTGWRARHGISPADPVIGVIGRLVPLKGQGRMIGQMRRIRERFPAARLVLVGDGPGRAQLEAYVRTLGLEEAVCFTGTQSDMASVLAAIDVVVVPSDHEGFSFVALEAMAAGKPVVATDVGGVREVLGDGECGVLVDVADDAALGDAIVEILSDSARARALTSAAARRLELFTLERHARELEKVYLRLSGRTVATGAS